MILCRSVTLVLLRQGSKRVSVTKAACVNRSHGEGRFSFLSLFLQAGSFAVGIFFSFSRPAEGMEIKGIIGVT